MCAHVLCVQVVLGKWPHGCGHLTPFTELVLVKVVIYRKSGNFCVVKLS